MFWPFFKKKLSPEEVREELKRLLEDVADFADRHDVFIPAITVRAGMVEAELSLKRVAAIPPEPPKEPNKE
jgi:hypothetical protein